MLDSMPLSHLPDHHSTPSPKSYYQICLGDCLSWYVQPALFVKIVLTSVYIDLHPLVSDHPLLASTHHLEPVPESEHTDT